MKNTSGMTAVKFTGLVGVFCTLALGGCTPGAPSATERYQAQLALVESQSPEGYYSAMLQRLEQEIAAREETLLTGNDAAVTPSLYSQMVAKKAEIAQTEASLARMRNELKELEDSLAVQGDQRINDVMVQLESTDSNQDTVRELAYLYRVSRYLQAADYQQVHTASCHFLRTQLQRLEGGTGTSQVSEFYREAAAGSEPSAVPETIPFPALLPADLKPAEVL